MDPRYPCCPREVPYRLVDVGLCRRLQCGDQSEQYPRNGSGYPPGTRTWLMYTVQEVYHGEPHGSRRAGLSATALRPAPRLRLRYRQALNAHFRVSLHDARAIVDALEQANDL